MAYPIVHIPQALRLLLSNEKFVKAFPDRERLFINFAGFGQCMIDLTNYYEGLVVEKNELTRQRLDRKQVAHFHLRGYKAELDEKGKLIVVEIKDDLVMWQPTRALKWCCDRIKEYGTVEALEVYLGCYLHFIFDGNFCRWLQDISDLVRALGGDTAEMREKERNLNLWYARQNEAILRQFLQFDFNYHGPLPQGLPNEFPRQLNQVVENLEEASAKDINITDRERMALADIINTSEKEFFYCLENIKNEWLLGEKFLNQLGIKLP